MVLFTMAQKNLYKVVLKLNFSIDLFIGDSMSNGEVLQLITHTLFNNRL